MLKRTAAAFLCSLLSACSAPPPPPAPPAPARLGAVRLPALFGDGMVLQAGLAAPVWGSAEAGAEVRVRIAGQSKSARAGADGRWSLKLDPIPAGGPHELVVEGEPAVVVRDVLVGEVWICSGQSNMEWNVNSSRDAETEKAAAQYPTIRLFTVPRRSSGEPQNDVVGAWKPCSPETVGSFSAVAYFFGRELARELQVPVGLIHSSWGGTAAELWTRREALEKDEALRPLVDGYADRVKRWEEATAKHKESVEKARAAGKQPPRAPGKPMAPSSLYNGMISPLVPYGIRGAIWYQGEANAGRAKQYETLFPALIRNWRQDWGQGEFPFGFVQLANFMKREEQPGESDWAELRDAQLKTLALPNTGMAVTIDVGDAADIHPKNKQEVGKRLALWAQAKVYRRDRVYSGPIFESSKVEGSKIRLGFKHAGSGLAASGGGRLRGFAVAGEDRRWVWADAVIEGTEVVVSSPSVPQPAAVRYGWANNPDCTLVNREGLPASPFRTDAWPRMK